MKFQRSVNPDWVHGNTIIWRYLSLDKLIRLLDSKSLYFTKADQFSDKHEFTLPASTTKMLREQYPKQAIIEAEESIEKYRNETFVSCWTMKLEESYHLWKIYLGDSKHGVAIKTTAGKLRQSLKKENKNKQVKMYHVRVKYSNFIKPDNLNYIQIASTKKEFYKGEDEARLFFSLDDDAPLLPINELGINFVIDCRAVIDSIYLSPFGGKAFDEAFSEMLQNKYKFLKHRVKHSEIIDS
jgi:hypothetical protein